MPSPRRSVARSCPVDARDGVVAFLATWLLAAVASSVVLVAAGATDDVAIGVLAASLLAGWVVYGVGVALTSTRLGSGDVRSDFGIRVAPADLVGIPLGVVAQIVAVPAVYVPLRARWPETFDDGALVETAEDLVERSPGALILLLGALVVVGAPVVEEIVYRGLLQRPLLTSLPAGPAIVLVAVVFAAIHFRPVEFPGLLVAGLVFGTAAWWTGRLGTSIAAHLAFNATGLAMVI
ncbi:CPBP family intramembrane glutamic endopeptidase [Ilumatobacter sp.]|uniref:CPBP family intramembrane glutamic endopeptidase n=1 Tax=Ilumatobacter sp. TaxID=1967498 RepID=UPI003B51F6C6